jgi:hypothetical protein
MPNHLHGILIIDNENLGASPCGRPLFDDNNRGQARGPAYLYFGAIYLFILYTIYHFNSIIRHLT